jgi:ADP-ribosyl-[dinitrogen reductase] hydrolase
MTGGGPHHRTPGGITDDTLQALAVACSLIHQRGFDPGDLMPRLIEAYRKNPGFFGPTSAAVFERVSEGMDPEEAARQVHEAVGSRSNGSVMRGAPIGIYYRDVARVREVSLACSRLTHYDPVAGECSAVVNVMVSRMSRGSPREYALQDALRECPQGEVREMLSHYGDYPVDPSLDALLTTHASISLFLSSGSFEGALIAAVNQGGDADTVGAITGALAGAYWGWDEIPARWIHQLQDAEDIRRTARALWEAAER